MKSSKNFSIFFPLFTIIILMIICTINIIIDPFFHYRKPSNNIHYILDNERYQNNGIAKHFDYDAIITGTSMTENFKTSEFDKLFNVNSVKMPFSGASYKEINDNLIVAFDSNKSIKLVVRCLDLYKLSEDPNKMSYSEETYPKYLYDDKMLNDIKYILNIDVLLQSIFSINNSIRNVPNTTFDDYANWMIWYNFSKQAVDEVYIRPSKKDKVIFNKEKTYMNVKNNINQNVIELAKEHPDTDFYYYFPPYSIYYWDNINQEGTIENQLDAIEYAVELIINIPNIHLYSFINEFDIVTNLNNYKDERHYSDKINSLILQYMKEGKDLLTKDNYKEYIEKMRNLYTNYDYDLLF